MSSDDQRITWRRNIAENFNRLSRVHERYRQMTDDRQTDGRTTTYSDCEREFTFAKNIKTLKQQHTLLYTAESQSACHSKLADRD